LNQQIPLDDSDHLDKLPGQFGVTVDELTFIIRRRNLKTELAQMNLVGQLV